MPGCWLSKSDCRTSDNTNYNTKMLTDNQPYITRKQSCGLRTACLPTYFIMNKFEYVEEVGVLGVGWDLGVPVQWGPSKTSLNISEGSMYSKVPSHVWGSMGGSPYGEVQCIAGNGHMWSPPSKPVDRMTDWHDWKYYLLATSLAGGNKNHLMISERATRCWQRMCVGLAAGSTCLDIHVS